MDFLNEIEDNDLEETADDLLFSIDTPDLPSDSLEVKDKPEFQKKHRFNHLLPYANEIDDEADALLAKIKANFGRCVMLREIKPGCVVWVNMLRRYIVLYDLRFTKEDHITFIKLLYELLTIPNLESSLIAAFGYMLYILLSKIDLISPDELELPWKPLYSLYVKVMVKRPLRVIFYNYCSSIGSIVECVVKVAKRYFPLSAAQEILDELRPQICPLYSALTQTTFKGFQLFLPVQLSPEHHSLGHELWLHEFIKLWEANSCIAYGWGNSIMYLMSKLATYNIGYIDWEPYMPLMFTKFIQSFNLPVCYKKIKIINSHFAIGPDHAGLWIASVLGDKSSAQIYLGKFLKTIETYFHPANKGSWLKHLGELFVNISNNVVRRVHRERYQRKQPEWITPIPESHKLTDADIDAFVNSMVPIAMLGIFNNGYSNVFYDALHSLAVMRPNLVIPRVLEKVFPTLDSDIEPHKLITAMSCMITISRPLVQGSRVKNAEYAYQEGPSYVLPLLFASLSGIDPNDPSKCFMTFRLIATYVTMVPIVDNSKTTVEMSESEREICEGTSRFEDFVLQFMDKIFIWIESSSVESVRLENTTSGNGKSATEATAESILKCAFYAVLVQTSHPIFMSALNKLRTFIMENVLETQVAGQLVATLCSGFAGVNGAETMKALLPFLSEKILDAIGEGDEVINAEHLDNELLYPLSLLHRLLITQGNVLLPHIDTLIQVIDKIIRFKSREGHQLACYTLNNLLHSLSTFCFINVERPLNDPDYLHIKTWGEAMQNKTIKIKTYTPGDEEMAMVQKIFTRYFIPAITSIENFIKTGNSLSRDEMQVTLRIINNIVDGCEPVLPFWTEPALQIKPYENCIEPFQPVLGIKGEIRMPDGGNVRYFLVKLMADLQEIILKNVEDDTKSLTLLLMIWQNLFLGRSRHVVCTGHKHSLGHLISKKDNGPIGNTARFPLLLLARVAGQHQRRKLCTTPVFTETHKNILMNLLKLSTSHYCGIRARAQEIIHTALPFFPSAYMVLTPYIIEILGRDPEDHHDAFKGILYLISRKVNHEEYLLLKEDWHFLKQLWPALVLSKPSEKLSVIHLKNRISDLIRNNFDAIEIELEVPDSCVSVASNLWNNGTHPSLPQPTEVEIKKGVKNLKEFGENNLKAYYDILDQLLHALLEKNLHWRHRLLAIRLLLSMMRKEYVYPPQLVRFFLDSLIHESIKERKLALKAVVRMLKQFKRKYTKINIEVPSNDNNGTTNNSQPGHRPDNKWLLYNYETRPRNPTDWDEPRYMHKSSVGYYTWPRELQVYAPFSKQPQFDKDCFTDQQREIHTFFSNQHNIDKLIEYLSLEGKTSRATFDLGRMLLFKGLFYNHGDDFLENFLPHLTRLVQNKKETKQRCAAEIICGLIRGAKHWSYSMSENMWNSICTIMRIVLRNLTAETINHWCLCVSNGCYNRDPNRLHWLLECLMEESPLGESEASFVQCGRLFILQSALTVHSWRVEEILQRLLLRFENGSEESPFQNVRDRLSSLLFMIFRNSILANGQSLKVGDFIERIYPRLESLIKDEEATKALTFSVETMTLESDLGAASETLSNPNGVNGKCENKIRLLKTICSWIVKMVMMVNLDSSFYKLYPIMCQLENYEKDEELPKLCDKSIAVLARTLILPEQFPVVLESVQNISENSSWSTRVSSLEFVQVLAFHNMSILLSNEAWIHTIESIVLRLLEDDHLEVREKAAQVLGGLLHCTIISDQEKLLEEFKKKAKTKCGKKRKVLPTNTEDSAKNAEMLNAARLRHAGVLGMCAFINAHPYDVPKHVPPIFVCLSSHLNDPEPIPKTIHKTLNDFKRTHCDGWTGLQGLAENFTDEQYTVFQDLTVPPSYYA